MSSVEDPFDQVANDTQEQIDKLKSYLSNHERDDEVTDILKDIDDTVIDLDRSIVVMKRSGQDVSERETKLRSIRSQYESLSKAKTPVVSTSLVNNGNISNRIDNDEYLSGSPVPDAGDGGMANPFQEQMLQEQDVHLDNIHHTMQNLHIHAQTMGQELEDQGQILDELDGNFDSITNKVQRGRRQLEWIYEKNKEKYNDCCIGLLIIALIVLLVLAFIV